MSFAVALALGFIIGNSISKLSLSALVSVIAGALTAAAFALLPFAWSGNALLGEHLLGESLLHQLSLFRWH